MTPSRSGFNIGGNERAGRGAGLRVESSESPGGTRMPNLECVRPIIKIGEVLYWLDLSGICVLGHLYYFREFALIITVPAH
jgi:hypothetical protein